MGKSTTFIGLPVLNQVTNYISKDIINILPRRRGRIGTLSILTLTPFVIMLYTLLTNFSSLFEVVLGFESNISHMGHFGMDYLVYHSTLTDVNKRHDWAFFETDYNYLYRLYEPVLSDSRTKKDILDKIYVIDSITISLFSEIHKGVGFNPKNGKKKGGIKAHPIINYDIDIPMMMTTRPSSSTTMSRWERFSRSRQVPTSSSTWAMWTTIFGSRCQNLASSTSRDRRTTPSARVAETRKVEGKYILSDEVIEVDYDKEIERPISPEELSHRRRMCLKSGRKGRTVEGG